MANSLTPEQLAELIEYDPTTGNMFWKPRPPEMFGHNGPYMNFKKNYEGREITSKDQDGYVKVSMLIHGERYHFKAHRVAWAIHYGSWPKGEVDHINHDRADNSIANLRDVSPAENQRNRPLQSNNKTGHVGVTWCERDRKFYAGIQIGGRRRYLGSFDDMREAVKARRAAEIEYGFHKNHGRSYNV